MAADDGTIIRSIDKRKAIARDRTLAIALIRGADATRYGTLIVGLSNQYAMGKDDYPTDITSGYSLLVKYKTPENTRARNPTPSQLAGALRPVPRLSHNEERPPTSTE